MRRYTLHAGDCRDVMRDYPADHFDSIVSDPPYGLSFMGKGWDRGVPGEEFWREALRVAKPGAHLLAFGGSRTFHRLTCAIEDAGWEIRDVVCWLYGSGFPKSLDVSKAIDATVRLGGSNTRLLRQTEQETGGAPYVKTAPNNGMMNPSREWQRREWSPTTADAQQWSGWGTALKPAWEPVIVARKPLVGTVAANVTRYGTGALNIDGCRVPHDEDLAVVRTPRPLDTLAQGLGFKAVSRDNAGRWPANVMHDGSDEVVAGFPADRPSTLTGKADPTKSHDPISDAPNRGLIGFASQQSRLYADSGSAARFFYCAKASRADREEGCEQLPARTGAEAVERDDDTAGLQSPRAGAGRTADTVRNFHPTVKPTDLMRYLARLVTPPDGLLLDPFMGSGSTGKGALLEGFRFVGIDLDPAHVAIAEARCQFAVDYVDAEAAAAEAPGAQLALF